MENIIIIGVIVVLILLGIRSSMKHFRGEGGCCGGSTPAPKQHKKLKNVIAKKTIIIEGMKGSVSFHDFRMVRGTGHTNLIFDIVLPTQLRSKEKDIQEHIDRELNRDIDHTYYTVVTFDFDAFNLE